MRLRVLFAALVVAGACLGPSTALASGVWSAPTNIGDLVNPTVSCSSATFCAAIGFNDQRPGNAVALTYNGTSWTAPTKIDSNTITINSLSCSSATFCVAAAGGVYYEGGAYNNGNGINALTYNGTSWTALTHLVGFLGSVSCSSATFCVAFGGPNDLHPTDALTYNGTSWTAPTQIIDSPPSCGVGCSAGGLGPVSCPSTTFCAAIDFASGGASALTYNGTSWSAPTLINGTGKTFPTSLSCPSATFCAALADNNGDALTYNGTSWTAPTQIDGDGGV